MFAASGSQSIAGYLSVICTLWITWLFSGAHHRLCVECHWESILPEKRSTNPGAELENSERRGPSLASFPRMKTSLQADCTIITTLEESRVRRVGVVEKRFENTKKGGVALSAPPLNPPMLTIRLLSLLYVFDWQKKNNHWFSFEYRRQFAFVFVIIYKVKNNIPPSCIAELFDKNVSRYAMRHADFTIPRFNRVAHFKHSLSYFWP